MNNNWSWKRYVAPFPTPLEHNFFSPDTHPNGHYFYSPPILLLNNRNFQSFEWKRVKRPFFEPGKLENHTNEGKGKEINNRARRKKGREEKTAMVAHLLAFIMATLNENSVFDGNVFKNPARYVWPRKKVAVFFNRANLEFSIYKVITLQTQGWYNGCKVC